MKLVLVCDYGLDDAQATVDALTHGTWDAVDIVAIGGNVPRAVSLRNAENLLRAVCAKNVTLVDTTAEEQPERFLKTIHGTDGMGDLFAAGGSFPAVSFSAWLASLCGEYELASLGPMTLIPRILAACPPAAFVFMGGNIAETPNYGDYEFNHALDRAAFSEAVKYPHAAITMDTCRHPALNIQDIEIAGGGLMRTIARRCRELTLSSGEKGCYIWDDIAIKYLRHPDWFSVEKATDRDGNELNVARYIKGSPYLDIMEL